jgi:hypothetical protein
LARVRPATQSGALVPFFFLACSTNSWPQSLPPPEENSDILEFSLFGGGSFFSGVNQQGAAEKLVNGGTVGGRAAYNFSKNFSLEANYNFLVNNVRLTISAGDGPVNAGFGDRIHSFAIDPVYNFMARGSRVRPYLTAGLGPDWFTPAKKARALRPLNTSAELAFNYGGGVKVHLNSHLGLRLDARGTFERNPAFGLADIPKAHLNGAETTLGLVL